MTSVQATQPAGKYFLDDERYLLIRMVWYLFAIGLTPDFLIEKWTSLSDGNKDPREDINSLGFCFLFGIWLRSGRWQGLKCAVLLPPFIVLLGLVGGSIPLARLLFSWCIPLSFPSPFWADICTGLFAFGVTALWGCILSSAMTKISRLANLAYTKEGERLARFGAWLQEIAKNIEVTPEKLCAMTEGEIIRDVLDRIELPVSNVVLAETKLDILNERLGSRNKRRLEDWRGENHTKALETYNFWSKIITLPHFRTFWPGKRGAKISKV